MRVPAQGKGAARAHARVLCCVLGMSAIGCGRFGFEVGPVQASDTADAGKVAPMLPGDGPRDASSDAASDSGMVLPESPDDAGLVGLPGTWHVRALPYASGAAASAVLSDGLHYLGGSNDFDGEMTRYQHHYVYDAATESWSAAPADIPDDDTWGARAHVFEDRLYLLGGFPTGLRLRVYDPSNDTWSSLQAPPADFQWGFASGVIGGALYAFGGYPAETSNAVGLRYDFAAGSWTSVAPIPQNQASGPLASAVVGGRLYVLNGNDNDGSTVLQIYDSSTDSWSTGAVLAGHLYEAAAAAVLGDRIYFLGGAENHNHSDLALPIPALVSNAVNIYDTVANSWSSGPPMRAPRMWATAQVYDGKLHVLGGLDAASRELSDHEVLAP